MNAVSWFAIPVTNLERAREFYCAIMSYDTMEDLVTPMGTCAAFPAEEDEVGGSLNPFMGIKPSTEAGVSVWLNANPDLQQVLDRVANAGGNVLEEKTSIGEFGYVATILDTEGNRIGLHSI